MSLRCTAIVSPEMLLVRDIRWKMETQEVTHLSAKPRWRRYCRSRWVSMPRDCTCMSKWSHRSANLPRASANGVAEVHGKFLSDRTTLNLDLVASRFREIWGWDVLSPICEQRPWGKGATTVRHQCSYISDRYPLKFRDISRDIIGHVEWRHLVIKGLNIRNHGPSNKMLSWINKGNICNFAAGTVSTAAELIEIGSRRWVGYFNGIL